MQNYVEGLFCFNCQSIFYTTKSSFYYDILCHDLFDLEITVIFDNYIIYASTLQFIAFIMTDAEEYKLLLLTLVLKTLYSAWEPICCIQSHTLFSGVQLCGGQNNGRVLAYVM